MWCYIEQYVLQIILLFVTLFFTGIWIMKIYNIFGPSFFKLSLRDGRIFNTSSATCLFNLLLLEILCYITLHSLHTRLGIFGTFKTQLTS